MDRERFERVVRNKVIIGEAFTLEDVANTMKCSHPMMPVCECPPAYVPPAWMTEMVRKGEVRKIGEVKASNPAARGRKIGLYSGGRYEMDEQPMVETCVESMSPA